MAKGERKRALRGRAGRMQGGRGSGRASSGQVRLWGRHAVEAALKNPNRVHRKLWATREAIESLDGELPEDFPLEYADVQDLARGVEELLQTYHTYDRRAIRRRAEEKYDYRRVASRIHEVYREVLEAV